jgi:intergrase/recombinase
MDALNEKSIHYIFPPKQGMLSMKRIALRYHAKRKRQARKRKT